MPCPLGTFGYAAATRNILFDKWLRSGGGTGGTPGPRKRRGHMDVVQVEVEVEEEVVVVVAVVVVVRVVVRVVVAVAVAVL